MSAVGYDVTGALVASLEALIGHESVVEEYVRFRIDLLLAQTEIANALRDRGDGLCAARRAPGGARLDPDSVEFDPTLLRSLLTASAASLRRVGRGSPDLERITRIAGDDGCFLIELTRRIGCMSDEGFLAAAATRLGVATEAILWAGRMLAAPFVHDALRRLGKADPSMPPPDTGCPSCGSVPGLATLLRTDGRRVLACGLCGSTWGFVRTRCPFCAADNRLDRLSVGPEDIRWIETCGRCGCYLITVDQRRMPEGQQVFPLVEAVASLYLENIAEQAGCARALPYMALR